MQNITIVFKLRNYNVSNVRRRNVAETFINFVEWIGFPRQKKFALRFHLIWWSSSKLINWWCVLLAILAHAPIFFSSCPTKREEGWPFNVFVSALYSYLQRRKERKTKLKIEILTNQDQDFFAQGAIASAIHFESIKMCGIPSHCVAAALVCLKYASRLKMLLEKKNHLLHA